MEIEKNLNQGGSRHNWVEFFLCEMNALLKSKIKSFGTKQPHSINQA